MDYNLIAEKYKNYGEHAATEWEFGYKHEIKLGPRLASPLLE